MINIFASRPSLYCDHEAFELVDEGSHHIFGDDEAIIAMPCFKVPYLSGDDGYYMVNDTMAISNSHTVMLRRSLSVSKGFFVSEVSAKHKFTALCLIAPIKYLGAIIEGIDSGSFVIIEKKLYEHDLNKLCLGATIQFLHANEVEVENSFNKDMIISHEDIMEFSLETDEPAMLLDFIRQAFPYATAHTKHNGDFRLFIRHKDINDNINEIISAYTILSLSSIKVKLLHAVVNYSTRNYTNLQKILYYRKLFMTICANPV